MFWEFLDKSRSTTEARPVTWDEKLGRRIRRFFQIFMTPISPRREDPLEQWERRKLEALEIEALEREMRRRDKRDKRERRASRERNG